MASLYRAGLIHGFFAFEPSDGGTNHKAVSQPIPEPHVLLALDVSTEDAQARFDEVRRAFLDGNGLTGEEEEIYVDLPPSLWAELIAEQPATRITSRYGVLLNFTSVKTCDVSIWVSRPSADSVWKWTETSVKLDNDVETGIVFHGLSMFTKGRNEGVFDPESVKAHVLWLLVKSYALAFLYGAGCIKTNDRGARPDLTFSESRKMKRNPVGLIERSRLLRLGADDVREVNVTLSLNAAQDSGWKEFNPFADERTNSGPRSEARQHMVREFMRRSKKGRLHKVRSFLRGNPALGRVHRLHNVSLTDG